MTKPAAPAGTEALSAVSRHDGREALLQARYRPGSTPDVSHWNETLALLALILPGRSRR